MLSSYIHGKDQEVGHKIGHQQLADHKTGAKLVLLRHILFQLDGCRNYRFLSYIADQRGTCQEGSTSRWNRYVCSVVVW